uniref:Transmembrane protein with metallophosphoesterase domain n=1 Tax=Geotrypetes seraphini TaxID=260995 RepID=A0A6P8QLX8_GEOSA|nr:transmembrane protein with metallophosphoesterase domain [Geotrypetes seraphini]
MMTSVRALSLEVKAVAVAGLVLISMLLTRKYLGESRLPGATKPLFRLQLTLFANLLMLIGSRYIWKNTVTALCRSSHPYFRSYILWKIVVFTFLTLAHFSFFTPIFLVAEEPYFISLAAYVCLGAYAILIFFLFALTCLQQSYRLVQKKRGSFPPKTSKNVVKPVAAIAVTAALSIVGLLNASQPPVVSSVTIPLSRLPPSLNKLKLVLLSDIHLGPTVGKTKMAMVVGMVNALKPDITVIVGDLTDAEVSNLKKAAEPLKELNSELGTYFVTGNHEYYTSDVDNWFKLLESMNIHPLHNENVKITGLRNSQDWFCLAGVDDIEANALGHIGHGMDLNKALNGCSQDHTIVLLAHQPLAAKWALQARPDIDLILSGHTHGGQMFPLTILAYLLNPFFSGLYKVGQKTFVYVSPGTVYYGIPMRLLSRAEITEFVLQNY